MFVIDSESSKILKIVFDMTCSRNTDMATNNKNRKTNVLQ